jgi:excisionase family DNA binding protein
MQIMTVPEGAEYLKVCESTLRHWMCRGLVPYVKMIGSVRLIREDLDAWLKENAIAAGKPPSVRFPRETDRKLRILAR